MSDDPRSMPHPATPSDDTPTGQIRQPSALSIEVVGETDKGRVRPGNEDNLIHEDPNSPLARGQGTLLVVSDGMGGHAAGEVASEIAVNTIHTTFYRNRGLPVAEAVRDAIVTANTAIYEAAQRNMERAGMGCTVVALVVQGADLTIGHVGDSRAYLIRDGVATQLTLDHSWVAMQVHEGILTPEQAEHHPNRSVLMRALGRYPAVEVDVSNRKLRAGDVLLVCSDGLTGMVTDAEIAEYASRIPPQALPRQLIDLANSRGAPDNVTVLIGAITRASAMAPGGVADPYSATTIIPPPRDARTPHLEPAPAGDSPTDRNLTRPKAADTIPIGRSNTSLPRASTPKPPTPAAAPSSPARGPAAAPKPRAPLGKPVVVARTSVKQPAGAPIRSVRGRSQWIAGAVAAFGLAGALLLLVAFQGGVFGTSSTSTVTSAAPPTAAPATAPPAAAATSVPAAAPPPPAATANPAVLLPAPAAATPISPSAAGKPTATTVPTPASSPAATNPTPTLSIPAIPAIPAIPTIRSLFGTPAPTATPGQRTGEAPSTSADAPGASGQEPGGGASSATTEPSTDEGQATETAPEGASPGAAPGPASDAAPQAKPGGGGLPRGLPQFGAPGRKPDDRDD